MIDQGTGSVLKKAAKIFASYVEWGYEKVAIFDQYLAFSETIQVVAAVTIEDDLSMVPFPMTD